MYYVVCSPACRFDKIKEADADNLHPPATCSCRLADEQAYGMYVPRTKSMRPCNRSLLLILLALAATETSQGFAPPQQYAASKRILSSNLQLFAKANGDGDISEESLYEDLRNRIQALGLDGESSGVGGGGALSGKPVRKGAEADEEKEYVYIGGERFYLPSQASSSSRPASMLDQEDRERPSDNFFATSPNGYGDSNAVSSRRELLEEAKPSIIGSLEGLALAISLFFVVTVAATGGSLFASNINSSSSITAAGSSQRWDPDALLQEDFARDGSSVFYGQTFDE